MPEAKSFNLKTFPDEGGKTPVAGEFRDAGAEEGGVRVPAGSGLAKAGRWPGEGRAEIVLTTIKGILLGGEGRDLLAREEVSHGEVAFGREEFAFAFEGAQIGFWLELPGPD